jgi:hypothetical protein
LKEESAVAMILNPTYSLLQQLCACCCAVDYWCLLQMWSELQWMQHCSCCHAHLARAHGCCSILPARWKSRAHQWWAGYGCGCGCCCSLMGLLDSDRQQLPVLLLPLLLVQHLLLLACCPWMLLLMHLTTLLKH